MNIQELQLNIIDNCYTIATNKKYVVNFKNKFYIIHICVISIMTIKNILIKINTSNNIYQILSRKNVLKR